MILILGCGFLGNYLLKELLPVTDEQIVVTSRSFKETQKREAQVKYVECDLTKEEDLLKLKKVCNNEVLTVFYFSACHNVDYVYENPEYAESVNVGALKNFTAAFSNIKKLFFSSTDCVYGESENGFKFKECSPMKPVNEYGRQKMKAEKIVLESGFTVLRLPYLLGPSLTDKKHFYDNIACKTENQEGIELIDGMERSAISYRQAARFIYLLSKMPHGIPSVINVCADSILTKYELGCMIAEKLNYTSDNIKKISMQEAEKFFKDKRASCTAMDNTLLKSILGIEKIELEI